MKEAVLLPFGDQNHIDALLDRLGGLVEAGRERDFAVLLPSAQLLHEFRARLVRTASRQLNLTTFDELVAAALKSSGIKVKGLDSRTAVEVMANILRNRAGNLPSLGSYARSRGMARELNYALGQLRRADISCADLAAALEAGDDPILTDLLVVWQDYHAFLAEQGLADLEEQYRLAADCLESVPWLGNVREIHVCWFFDFEPLQLSILDKLPAGADIAIWLPYRHPAHAGYIDKTIQSLRGLGFSVRREQGKANSLTEKLFLPPSGVFESPRVQGLSAPRLKQELELAAQEIKKLIPGGVSPGDILLVLPDQRKYLPLLRRLYREHRIELAMPLVTDLTAVPWVREVLSIWQAGAAGWDRDSLLGIAGTTYITAHLSADYDGDVVEWAITSLGGNFRGEMWLARLDREIQRLTRQVEECGESWVKKNLEQPLKLFKEARPGIQGWIEQAVSFSGSHTPHEHCRQLQGLLEDNMTRIAPEGDSEEEVRDRVALDKVQAAVRDYLACCNLLGRTAPIPAGQFIEDFSPWLELDLSLERSNPGAVRILSPAQVRGLQCKNVFVLGLNQGTFPRAAMEHWLLDRAAALPGLARVGRGAALDQEKIFFHSCVAAARDNLFLSRLSPGVEQEAEASSFWREVSAQVEGGLPEFALNSSDLLPPLQPGSITSPRQLRQRLTRDIARGATIPPKLLTWLKGGREYPHLAFGSRVEQRRESPAPPDNMDGVLENSASILEGKVGKAVYSISRLEQYARCPFAFFAKYVLGLNPAPQDVPEYSALDRGTLLHWLLEHFYSNYLDQADTEDPRTIRIPLEQLARQWLEQKGRDPENTLWRLRARDAVNMVQALIETDLPWLKRTGLRPVFLEATFGLPGSQVDVVRPGGGMVSFHGKVDRIDVVEREGETWAVVYDYKTSREVTQKDIINGKSLQIPVYLAAVPALLAEKGYSNVRVMGGGYYVIREAKLAGGIWDKEFTSWTSKRLGSLETQEFQELEQILAAKAQELHQGILEGNFQPDPDPGACAWCDYSRCCRYDKNRLNLKKGGEDDAAQS